MYVCIYMFICLHVSIYVCMIPTHVLYTCGKQARAHTYVGRYVPVVSFQQHRQQHLLLPMKSHNDIIITQIMTET